MIEAALAHGSPQKKRIAADGPDEVDAGERFFQRVRLSEIVSQIQLFRPDPPIGKFFLGVIDIGLIGATRLGRNEVQRILDDGGASPAVEKFLEPDSTGTEPVG